MREGRTHLCALCLDVVACCLHLGDQQGLGALVGCHANHPVSHSQEGEEGAKDEVGSRSAQEPVAVGGVVKQAPQAAREEARQTS